MSNISIEARQIDGGLMPIVNEGLACKAIVESFVGDDVGAPVIFLDITVHTASGKTVIVRIPNDAKGVAAVRIDGVEV